MSFIFLEDMVKFAYYKSFERRRRQKMRDKLNLIVMLTYNDKTVQNAYDIFEQCKDSKAEFWGMKEAPLPLSEMKRIFDRMKACGKVTALETVAYTEEACLSGAAAAAACGCDILMGTKFFDSVNNFCCAKGLKYMPFVGDVDGRPSILQGSAESMLTEAHRCLKKGVYGFDLLGYRYTGDASRLNSCFVSGLDVPVCIAGSVDSFARLDELKAVKPWAFTIGSAFFENKFGNTFKEQIDTVCDYMEGTAESDV